MTETPDCLILVAEDNPADVTLVREALKRHDVDCTLHVSNDGAKAIAFLNALDRDPKLPRLDLVLLDMHLPKLDGEDILKRLRSTEHYGQTPVIVMTASDAPDDREKAEKNAALSYFRKPTSLAEYMKLGALVRSVLDPGCGSPKRGSRAMKNTEAGK
jgi:CheY-like chemotaxis protein